MLFYVSTLLWSAYQRHYDALSPLTPILCLCSVCGACTSAPNNHSHTPDLYNAPKALDTSLLGKVARERRLAAFKTTVSHTKPPPIAHTQSYPHTHRCLCSNYIFMLVKLSRRQSGGTSVSLAGGGPIGINSQRLTEDRRIQWTLFPVL